EYITYCNEHQDGGFLGRLFSRKPREVSPQEALSSLGDFWKCCLNLYYMDPARKWIESPAGAKELKNIMYSLMSTKLNYDEMQTLLSAESMAVLTLAENVKAQLPKLNLAGCNSMAKMLHAIAIYSVKCEISAQILQMLADTMKALSNNAGGFDELLEMVQNSLSEDRMERSVVVAYGSYVNELIDQNEEVLLQTIRPSKDENELLQQLEAVFADFVERDVKRIFQKSLQGDLQFRVQQGSAVAAANAISDCFSYKMTEAVRLPTLLPPSGNLYLYCIMNDAMEDLGGNIADDAVGHRFIVTRSDRIERLFLFKVDESNIMFSNQPE
ncbi:MAG: hypothetical protein IKM59_04040, partial [Oscillospiraceae bacterium]|nr:hypothetical protein [Oscillospiraceae bacterium]